MHITADLFHAKKENEIPNAVCGFGKAAYVKDLTLNIIRRK